MTPRDTGSGHRRTRAPDAPRPITERLGLVLVAALVAVAMVAATVADGPTAPTDVETARPVGAELAAAATASPRPTPTPTPRPVGDPASWVVAGPDGAPLAATPGGPIDEVAAPGLTWPILEEVDGGYRVATHCARDGWVDADDVERPNVARGAGMAGAVIVVDAGHGGLDAGASGPAGVLESEVNLAVAVRLRDLLERANDIDDETGEVTTGDTVPPVAAVVMTRDPDDGKGGDQRTALTFRGRLATGADADALVSVHHNAGDTRTLDEPPSEVFYSVADEESGRLAGLVLEELRRSLAPLADQWRGTTLAGTIGREDPDGTDYYTVLEQAEVPAVIAEALYLSDPAAEELAATDEFQEIYAEALYRALVRFLATEATGSEVNEPIEFTPGDAEPYDYSSCSLALSPEDGGEDDGGE